MVSLDSLIGDYTDNYVDDYSVNDYSVNDNSVNDDSVNDDLEEITFGDDGNFVAGTEESVVETLPTPRLELEGVLLEEELIFIRDNCSPEPNDSSLPLYVVFGFDSIKAGYLEMDLNTVLKFNYLGNSKYVMKLIGDGAEVELLSRDSKESDVMKLLNFIKLRY